jgi:hypothetical protein
MMQIHFQKGNNQSRWAWTEGLRALGQREIAVMLPWPEHDPRDLLITDVFRFLENYLRSHSQRILPGQTLRYGWTLLRFMSEDHHLSGAGPDALVIFELKHPFAQEDQSYVSGVAQTIALLQLQQEAIQRNRLTGKAIYPSPADRALVCRKMTPEALGHLRPLIAQRAWPPAPGECGWFVGCCDQVHDHDNPAELTTVHLLHVVERFPALFPYVAMPVGTALLFEANQTIIFRPGEQEGQGDPGRLLSSLPL